MTWYNPLSWFSQTPSRPETTPLYCDNLQCQKPIESNFMIYSSRHRTVYHFGRCADTAISTLSSQTETDRDGNTAAPVSIPYKISRERALKLLREGKLAQFENLEERVTNPSK